MRTTLEHYPIQDTPVSRILTYTLPDLHEHTIARVKQSIDVFIKEVQMCRAKDVVINVADAEVTVNERTFSLMINYLIISLKTSNIKRAARMQFNHATVEAKAKVCFAEMDRLWTPAIQTQHFVTQSEAFAWLRSLE